LFGLSMCISIVAVARMIEMPECRCPECNRKLVELPHVPSPLDNIVCPKCRRRDEIGFFIPVSLGSVVVVCRCERCGCKWSVRVVLPKNFFG